MVRKLHTICTLCIHLCATSADSQAQLSPLASRTRACPSACKPSGRISKTARRFALRNWLRASSAAINDQMDTSEAKRVHRKTGMTCLLVYLYTCLPTPERTTMQHLKPNRAAAQPPARLEYFEGDVKIHPLVPMSEHND